jgi:Family of unknown function (DUF5681)
MKDFDVGFGKPPRKSQFKKGRSGNPAGRPKGARNLANDLSAELSEQITIREGGRSRRLSKQRALIKSLTAKALHDDVRATAAVIALYAKVITESPEEQSAPIESDELEILRRYAPRLLNKKATRKPKSR